MSRGIANRNSRGRGLEHFFVGEAGALGIDYIAAIGESEAAEEVLHVEVVVVGVDFYAMHTA